MAVTRLAFFLFLFTIFRPPVIYLTSNTYLDIAHHVCLQLGLPLSTVRVLNSNGCGVEATNGGIDAELKMEEIFNEDKAAGRLPTLCIANVHSSLFQVIIIIKVVCLRDKYIKNRTDRPYILHFGL